jgi:hypothetical protein
MYPATLAPRLRLSCSNAHACTARGEFRIRL